MSQLLHDPGRTRRPVIQISDSKIWNSRAWQRVQIPLIERLIHKVMQQTVKWHQRRHYSRSRWISFQAMFTMFGFVDLNFLNLPVLPLQGIWPASRRRNWTRLHFSFCKCVVFFWFLIVWHRSWRYIDRQKACSCALVHKTLSVYIRELWFLKSKKSTCHDLLLQVRACSDSATLSGLAAVVVTKSAHFSIRFFPSAILTCSRVQAIIIASVIHQFIAGMFGIVWFLNQIIKLNLKPCRSEFLVSGSHPCWGTGQLPPIPAAA